MVTKTTGIYAEKMLNCLETSEEAKVCENLVDIMHEYANVYCEESDKIQILADKIFKMLISDGTFIKSYNLAEIITNLPFGCLKDNSFDLAELCNSVYSTTELSKRQILEVLVLVKNCELEC